MKDAYQVLYKKEADLARIRREIESLKVAASLLAEDRRPDDSVQGSDNQDKKPMEEAFAFAPQPEAAATGTDGPSPIPRQPGFWESLKGRRR
jgi:hypothetical protein